MARFNSEVTLKKDVPESKDDYEPVDSLVKSPFDSHSQPQDDVRLKQQKEMENELPQIPDKPTKATIGMGDGEGKSTVGRGTNAATLNATSSRPTEQGREQRRFTVPEIIMRR